MNSDSSHNVDKARIKLIVVLGMTSAIEESEASRPKGRGFPVGYFPFILCPLTPPSRAGLMGHLPVKTILELAESSTTSFQPLLASQASIFSIP